METKEVEEVMGKFGLNPNDVGFRNRGFWIVEEIQEEEKYAGASVGDLCVKTRDGGDNEFVEPDEDNYIGTIEDGFDCTYRYYYFRPQPPQ